MSSTPHPLEAQAHETGHHHHQGGGQAQKDGEQKDGDKDQGGGQVNHCGFPDFQDCVEDEHADTGPDSGEGVGHSGQVGEAAEEEGDDCDDQDAGADDAQGGHDATGNPLVLVADKGGGVHSDDPGGTLANGEVVGKLLLGGPPLLLHYIPLEDGQHGVAAPEGAGAGAEEGGEKI